VSEPEFRLLPLDALKIHEEVVDAEVAHLAQALRTAGVVTEPIWVARGSLVILNGHHRFQALRSLHARFAPAWVLEYEDPEVELDRWGPGPVLTKPEVIERAVSGHPYPPKTTRHRIRHPLPHHPTTLDELGVAHGTPPSSSEGHSAR
jgi:hypothetical protein